MERDPERRTQDEIEAQATSTAGDPTTAREELELGLREAGEPEAGEHIGDQMP